jgi:hypothetical protein
MKGCEIYMTDTQLYTLLFSNNTYNHDAMTKTLNITKESSFQFLNNLQYLAAGYRRFDFKMTDLTSAIASRDRINLQYPKKYLAFIKNNFISEKNRLEYKKSDFFGKEVDMKTIADNSDIFSNAYLVFVNGKFIDSTTLMCKDNHTYIVFNISDRPGEIGIPRSYFESLLEANVDITIYFVPNCAYGVLNTNLYALEMYKNQLSLQQFDISGHLSDDASYIAFINENNLLYTSIITDVIDSDQYLRFYSGNNSLPYDSKIIHFNIFGLRNLLDIKSIDAGETWFELPIKDMPVPKENLIPFREIDGKKLFAHDVVINSYYPNIYSIQSNMYPQYPLSIFVVYFDDTTVSISKHKNELSLYYKYIENILDQYKNDTIPTLIKNYIPKSYIYSIDDYRGSNNLNKPLHYKKQAFETFISVDFNITKDYFYNLLNKRDAFYLYIENIDLNTRLRTNNYSEITDINDQEEFTESRYVFIFNDELMTDYENLRFFIDGIYYLSDKKYRNGNYVYYYIPISLIHSDSIMEIERGLPFYFETNINYGNTNYFIDVECNNGAIPVYVNDIYLIDNTTNTYIDRDMFAVQIQDTDGSYIIMDNDSFTEIKDSFQIAVTDESLLLKDITLYINKFSQRLIYEVTISNILNASIEFPKKIKNDVRNIRIFRNGRLIPPSVYTTDFGVTYSNPIITIMTSKTIGDIYIIEYIPNKYNEVLRRTTISNTGIIDVIDIANKAMDIKYYDFFLNGKKLNTNNLDFLTPTKLRVKNVNTTLNFNIIEKDINPIPFYALPLSLRTTDDDIFDLTDVHNAIVNEHLPISNDEPNYIPPIGQEYTTEEVHNMKENVLKVLELINPNEEQITPTMIDDYPNVFSTLPYLINPNNSYLYTQVLDFTLFPSLNFT